MLQANKRQKKREGGDVIVLNFLYEKGKTRPSAVEYRVRARKPQEERQRE